MIYRDLDFKPTSLRLNDAEYERAMLAFPILCADVVFIVRDARTFLLADRIVHPVKGWWWIGGRVLRGESFEDAAIRKLREETGLLLKADRLTYIETVRHCSGVRQQNPQDAGTDTVAFTYVVELSMAEREVVSAGLVPSEYRSGSLTAFHRDQFESVGIRQQVRDLYNLVFP